MNLNELTAAQRAELKAQLAEQEKAEKAKRKADVEAYKKLVSETIEKSFEILRDQSNKLAEVKTTVYNMFTEALTLKSELYGVKDNGQFSHSFTNEDSTLRIMLGNNTLDEYDDTANTGIAMVNEYLDELSSNEDAEQAVKICRSLLARDKKGTLKPGRIMTLRKHALESGNKKFITGVDIIMEAYKPTASKQYIRAEYKTDQGEWKSLPLGITEA
jgi:Protein of unknown function (DUF3164).